MGYIHVRKMPEKKSRIKMLIYFLIILICASWCVYIYKSVICASYLK